VNNLENNIEDLYNKHAVKIISGLIEGSGCIIQPACPDYSYIFTAKHCLTEDNTCDKETVQIKRFNCCSEFTVIIHDIYLHTEYDIAIIKIDKIPELLQTTIHQPIKDQSVSIYGYPLLLKGQPETRENLNFNISFRRETHSELTSDKIQFTFEKSVPEAIIGFSGSGVFYEKDLGLCVVGILTKLKAPDGAYSKFCAFDIKLFEELICSKNLSSLYADNLSDINKDSTLQNKIFSISYNEHSEPYYQERDIDEKFLIYLNHSKNIWVSGQSGVGKTLLILRNLHNEDKEPVHIDLTCSGLDNIDQYFEYINNELIRQSNLENKSDKPTIYDKISDNLCEINSKLKDITIFVDEVPISDKDKFYDFISGFIKISERYSNINRIENKIKWIISTIIDPTVHINAGENSYHKQKAQKNFIFNNLTLWIDEELISLLNLLQKALTFSLSADTQNAVVKISEGLPGRVKSTIERVLLENCTIEEAIEMIKSENI